MIVHSMWIGVGLVRLVNLGIFVRYLNFRQRGLDNLE